MADKPRQRGPRPQAGEGKRGKASKPRFGPQAGKSKFQPARNRQEGGLDERSLEILEQEGLLTKEGKQLKARLAVGAPASAYPARRPAPRGRVRAPEDRTGRDDRPRTGGTRPVPRSPRKLNPAETLVAERLHKVMAQAGVASRRHSEELIRAGRVTVNGRVVTEMGSKVLAGKDVIEVDGRPLGRPENLIYILLNKPKGYVTTLFDPQNRPKVVDLLGGDIGERVYPVGRLDFDTEGILLLTNDGELANALMHPSRKVKKTYIAKVRGVPGPAKIAALEQGIELDDGPTAPAEVKMVDVKGPNAATLSIRIHEGRNRQVRRMFEALGHEVIHLKRTTLGPLQIKDLMPGQWRELAESEVNELRYSAGLQTIRTPRQGSPREEGGARQERAQVKGAFRPKGPSPDPEQISPPAPRRIPTAGPVRRGEGPWPKPGQTARRAGPPAARRDGPPPGRREGSASPRMDGPRAKGSGPAPRRAGPSPGRPRGPRP